MITTTKKKSNNFITKLLLLMVTLSTLFAMYLSLSNHVHAEDDEPATSVPSIEYKGAPDIIATQKVDEYGNIQYVYAEIIKEDEKPRDHTEIDEVIQDITKVRINVTPLSNAQDNIIDYDGYTIEQKVLQTGINTNLVDAYDELKECISIGELNKDLDSDLKSRAQQINKDYLSYVYVVTDVFDITLVREQDKMLLAESDLNYCRVIISPSYQVTDANEVLVIHKTSDGVWKVVPREDTIVLPSGDIQVYFDSMCPIAILKISDMRIANLENYINGIGRTCVCPSWCPFCQYLTVGGICFCWIIPVVFLLFMILAALIAVYREFDQERIKYRRPKPVMGPDIDIFEDDEVVSSRKKKKKAPRKPKLTSRLLYPKLTPIPAFDVNNLPIEVYPNMEDNYMTLFYNRSFTSRLMCTTDFVKQSYQQLKDVLLSHDVTNKMSWKYDSFRYKRKTIVRLSIRGKILNMYIQLDPLQFEGDEKLNHVYNVSDKKSHQLTPTLVKINNKKGLKQAIKLLNILFKEKEIKDVEYQQKDFISALTWKRDRALINMGLVKLRVKRTPFKITYAKSVLIQKEATKESVNFFKDNDAINMIDYTTDIQKPRKPVLVYTDELSEYYNDGEVVTLHSLKSRIKKFPRRATFLKIENRGTLNKRLLVICDNIDIESTKMILLSGGRVFKSKKENE